MSVVELLVELGGIARRRALLQVLRGRHVSPNDVRHTLLAAVALAELLSEVGRGHSSAA